MAIKKIKQGKIIWADQPDSEPELSYWGCLFSPTPGFSLNEALSNIAQNPSLLNELEAEIALVYYEPANRKLTLIRDAFGQCPLFYSPIPGGLVWATSLPDLLQMLDQTPAPNESLIFDYLATHYRHIFRQPQASFYQNVFQVPAGAAVSFKNGQASCQNWLDLTANFDTSMSPLEASRHFLDILRENVHLRWAALAPEKAAATISSGLDSSTVSSLIAEKYPALHLYSVGYEGDDTGSYDETSGIKIITESKTSWHWHHLMLKGQKLIADISSLMTKTRSPLITVTWLAYYQLAQRAKRDGFNVLFTGLGGDECLAGEFEHFFYFFADLRAQGEEKRLAQEAAGWQTLHDHPVFKKNKLVLENYFQENIDFKNGAMKVLEKRRQANWLYFNQDWVKEMAADPPMPRPFKSFLANRLYQEIKFETTVPTLWAEAASSQAAGLRGSYPFLSPRLLRFALAVPGTYKYENGLTKALLRRALPGILPEKARNNPVKTGFNAPLHHWLKEQHQEIFAVIKNGPALKNGWLSEKALRQIFQEHLQGQVNHMMLLWPLLCFSLWEY